MKIDDLNKADWELFKRANIAGNHETASKKCKELAERHYAPAQFAMGQFYDTGFPGFPVNDVLAYMWFSIAGSNGSSDGARARDNITKSMNQAQIAEAQKKALKWLEKHPKK